MKSKPQQKQIPSINLKPNPYNPKLWKQKQQLYYIFTYYCSFADRQNYEYLKIQNFKRMLTDAQLIQNNQQNLQLDLLFSHCKKNNNGMDFQTFLGTLPEIVKIVKIGYQFYGRDQDIKQGLRKIVEQNFHALYLFIFQNTQFGKSIKYLSKTSFSQSCFILLRSLSPTIYRIYTHFFDINSVKITNQRSQLFKKLTNFTKSFELTPQMLTKTQSFIIFNYIIDQLKQSESVYKCWFQQDKNNKNKFIFDYFCFISFLLIVSLIINKKIVGGDLVGKFQKLVNLMETMQVSKGFEKLCKTQLFNLHLIPNSKLVKQLQTKNKQQSQISFIQSSPERRNLSNSPRPNIPTALLQNYPDLHQKFISLCLQGQTIGSSALTHKKAIDIITRLKLGLKQSQIEVSLASVKKILDFEVFMEILEKISQKQFIQMEDLVEKFMQLSVKQEIQHERLRSSRNQGIQNRKQYRNCVAMVQLLQKYLKIMFLQQAQPTSLKKSKSQQQTQLSFISLNSYLKIMHDFQLSPIYLTKQSLIEIFRQSIKKSYDFMTFNQFKDSFIIALPFVTINININPNTNTNTNINYHENDSNYKKLQPQTKMIVIFQRINQSRGSQRLRKKNIQLRKQDHLIKFRHIFHQYYPQQVDKNIKYNSQRFNKMIQ